MIHKSVDNDYGNAIAFFAGSFNPFTKGHLSIVERAAPLFKALIVGVGVNVLKVDDNEIDDKIIAIKKALLHIENVDVIAYDDLTVDAARRAGASVLIRGVRDFSDFEYEMRMADVNRQISGIETLMLPALPQYSAVSSSMVRELKKFGRDITEFLP